MTQERETAFFLATQNSLTLHLLQGLREIEGYVEVLFLVSEQCASMYESKQYVLPDEKHTLLKVSHSPTPTHRLDGRPTRLPQVIAFSVYLMDDTNEKISFYRAHKGSERRYDAILKVSPALRAPLMQRCQPRALQDLPIVPLYGDMHLNLLSFMETSPHFDKSRVRSSGCRAARPPNPAQTFAPAPSRPFPSTRGNHWRLRLLWPCGSGPPLWTPTCRTTWRSSTTL